MRFDVCVVAMALAAVACATTGKEEEFGGAGSGGATGGGAGNLPVSDASLGIVQADSAPAGSLTISPSNPTVTVTITDGVVQAPSLQFQATSGTAAINAGWSVDQGSIGTITSTGVFTPTGTVGGVVNVIAGVGSTTASTAVTVILNRTQNGFTGSIDLTQPGGYGGVGGEGPGGPVSPSQATALQQTPVADPTRSLLYPYSGTVWPRGLLAPLFQWTPGAADAQAIAMHLQSKTYIYDGTFGRPAALTSTTPFVRHPIPQDVWQQATESTAGADTLTATLTFLVGAATVGPLVQTWKVAPGILQGTVYYESYGTQLVTNSDFTAQDGSRVGAAVLGIKPGSTAPSVVAGTSTSDGQGCRACHSVAAKGSELIVQDAVYPYSVTSLYDLQTLGETPMTPQQVLAWAALSPDGAYALSSGVFMGTATDTQTELFRMAAPAATPVAGALPAGVVGATPAFSPDGTHVAFTHVSGTVGTLTGDGSHVVALSFDPSSASFSSPKNVFTIPAGQTDCVGFPSFMPTNDAVLVQLQLAGCKTSSFQAYVGTGNVHGEIWWSDLATATQHRLDALDGYNPDGTSYLPTGANNHSADTQLNYEPTVNPAPSGGYAWVIFTSRRLYGNVATIDPFDSDPRDYDYAHQTTTKKLWVAAIDLNAAPGTDPSHPAFYLPAQELQAGNARGFWVLDPCKSDGASCMFGDECCGGFCQPASGGGGACASQTSSCSEDGEQCSTSANCCSPEAQCVDGFCAAPVPR